MTSQHTPSVEWVPVPINRGMGRHRQLDLRYVSLAVQQ